MQSMPISASQLKRFMEYAEHADEPTVFARREALNPKPPEP